MARLLRKRLFFVRRSRIHTSGPQGVPPTKAATDAAILYGLSRATVADRLFECLSSSGRPGDARWWCRQGRADGSPSTRPARLGSTGC